MNTEAVLECIKNYKKIPTFVIASCLKERSDEASASAQEIQFIAEILSLEVSGISRFIDSVWAFPEAQENAAKTHFASRFEIDFRAYSAIPELVLFQSKLVLLMAMLVPRSELSKGQKKNSALKVQSVLPLFKGFLSYLNHVFSNMNSMFGNDVVIENFQSLDEIGRITTFNTPRDSKQRQRWLFKLNERPASSSQNAYTSCCFLSMSLFLGWLKLRR